MYSTKSTLSSGIDIQVSKKINFSYSILSLYKTNLGLAHYSFASMQDFLENMINEGYFIKDNEEMTTKVIKEFKEIFKEHEVKLLIG